MSTKARRAKPKVVHPRAPAPPSSLRAIELRYEDDTFVVLSFPLSERSPLPAKLTATEAAVVELLLAGRRASQIAELRGTSARTVANQIQSIYKKLAVSSRAELVRLLGSP